MHFSLKSSTMQFVAEFTSKKVLRLGKWFLLTAFESVDDLIFYGMTIQMKPFQQYFHMVLFIQYTVLTFVSVEIKNFNRIILKRFFRHYLQWHEYIKY